MSRPNEEEEVDNVPAEPEEVVDDLSADIDGLYPESGDDATAESVDDAEPPSGDEESEEEQDSAEPESAEEGEPAVDDEESDAPAEKAASAPDYYTVEEMQEPGFWGRADHSRIRPEFRDEFVKMQRAYTRVMQELKGQTPTQKPDRKTEQEPDPASQFYSEEELRAIASSPIIQAIVDKRLSDLGIDLEVTRKVVDSQKLVEAASPLFEKYPEIRDDEAFTSQMNSIILADPELSEDFYSSDTARIRRALRYAAAEVKLSRAGEEAKRAEKTAAEKLKATEEAKKQREAANRKAASASKAHTSRKAEPPRRTGSLRDDVEELLEGNPALQKAFG